jgi:hypothetical protein
MEELPLLLFEWNIPQAETYEFFDMADTSSDDKVSFEDCFNVMRAIWRFIFDNAIYDIAVEHCPCKDHAGSFALDQYLKKGHKVMSRASSK